jgi:hypothetical protein
MMILQSADLRYAEEYTCASMTSFVRHGLFFENSGDILRRALFVKWHHAIRETGPCKKIRRWHSYHHKQKHNLTRSTEEKRPRKRLSLGGAGRRKRAEAPNECEGVSAIARNSGFFGGSKTDAPLWISSFFRRFPRPTICRCFSRANTGRARVGQ